jgi:hypothetical protein
VATGDLTEQLNEAEARLRQQVEAHGWGTREVRDASARVVAVEREIAADRGEPYSVPLDLGVRWDPNATDPWLIQTELTAYLTLEPFDASGELVVVRWRRCRGAVLGPPNDEARNGHPLWRRGLDGCLWAAEVHNSDWIARLERQNRVHSRHRAALFEGLRHFVLLLKDSTFECVADDFEVFRMPGPPLEAIAAGLKDHQRQGPRFTVEQIRAMRDPDPT